jgi:hypothetical protein
MAACRRAEEIGRLNDKTGPSYFVKILPRNGMDAEVLSQLMVH